MDPRAELASIVVKAKNYVAEQRKLHPSARIVTESPLASSSLAREAKLLTALDKVPASASRPSAEPETRPVKVLFVSELAIDDSGPAGRLLSKIIQAMGLLPQDVATCALASLQQAIVRLKPRILVALGATAAQGMVQPGASMARGRFAEYGGLPLMPTRHPAELLKDDSLKRQVWEDMKLVALKLKD